MADLSGKRFDDYQLMKRLGKGNFGEVYLAEHIYYKTQDAVKILYARLDTNSALDFINEARNFRLEHPGIVRIKDFGVENFRPFLVMNYTPNGNLRQRHLPGTQVPWETVVTYVRQIADALQCAHDKGIVHRDIKPENLLVGPNDEILLGDFGIATPSYTWNPEHGQQPRGTPIYIAPEQINGQAVRASDQYALGVVMYEWLTGIPPFKGTLDEVLIKHSMAKPPPPSDRVPTLLSQAEELVMKMLAKNPQDRFASMREVIAALGRVRPNPIFVTPSVFKGHADGVRTVAWSPNGQYVASAGRDKTVQVWEAATGSIVYTYHGHVGELWCVAWSPDSKYLVSAGADKTVQVWEATTGYSGTMYNEHTAIIRAVAWSPDGLYIASGSDDHTVRVWEMRTGATVGTYRRHNEEVSAVTWSPDSTYIASGGEDRTVHLWKVGTDAPSAICRGHTDRVTSISWSPDGLYIASGSDDHTVRVWQAMNGQRLYTYAAHSNGVAAVAWSPKDNYIASGSWDTTIHIWKIDEAEAQFIYRGHSSWVNALAWSPDGDYLVSGSWDKTAHIWTSN